jgi:acetyltransferase-like isoleucine patch superfamily enzyme
MGVGSGVRQGWEVWRGRVARWRRLPTILGRWWWWLWPLMQLSWLPCLGRLFTWLAGLPLGPYRAKRVLARVRPYVSPRAQIGSADVCLSRGCFIDDFVIVASGKLGGSVTLGERVCVYRGTIVEVDRGAEVTVGADTHIQAGCILNALVAGIRIGRDVMIAPHCGLFSYQYRGDDLNETACRQELISKGDIVIEDDAWLGTGAMVMDGVRIGKGAIVGAGAVVTDDIPSYGIATGVPARVTRMRVPGGDDVA